MVVKNSIILHTYVELGRKYLRNYDNALVVLNRLETFPEIFQIYASELDAALGLFNRLQNDPFNFLEDIYILPNGIQLNNILLNRRLPYWNKLSADLYDYSKGRKKNLWNNIYLEMANFEFLESKLEYPRLSGALFVALYRTYVLNLMPDIRLKGSQVASVIEEMLAVLAISGFQTQLYLSTRHWILDYKNEGFSPVLAEKVENV